MIVCALLEDDLISFNSLLANAPYDPFIKADKFYFTVEVLSIFMGKNAI